MSVHGYPRNSHNRKYSWTSHSAGKQGGFLHKLSFFLTFSDTTPSVFIFKSPFTAGLSLLILQHTWPMFISIYVALSPNLNFQAPETMALSSAWTFKRKDLIIAAYRSEVHQLWPNGVRLRGNPVPGVYPSAGGSCQRSRQELAAMQLPLLHEVRFSRTVPSPHCAKV